MSEILYFNLWDYSGAHISGDAYRQLIEYCFAHCAALSLSFHGKNDLKEYMAELLPFTSLSLSPNILSKKDGIVWLQHKNFYSLSDDLRDFLLRESQSLFDWKFSGTKAIPEPEDLCFYREDGSGMFWSCTHEGECAFFLREGEERPAFASNKGWELLEADHPYYEGFVELAQELKVESGSEKSTEDGLVCSGFTTRISIE